MLIYQVMGLNLYWNMAKKRQHKTPNMGGKGYKGILNLLSISGRLPLKATTERLTKAKVNKNIRLAPAPTTSMGRKNAIKRKMTPLTITAMYGVLLFK